MIAQNIINNALLLIGAIGTGEDPTINESYDALVALNDLIDLWQTERLMLPTQRRIYLGLVPNQLSYWLGTDSSDPANGIPSVDIAGGAIVRPLSVHQAGVLDNNTGLELPVRILTAKEYDRIPLQALAGTYPEGLRFEPRFPNALVTLYPTPTSSSLTLLLLVDVAIPPFASVSDSVLLPPGYARALRYALAIELAEHYGKQASPAILAGAAEAKDRIKNSNPRKPEKLRSDLFPGRRSTNFDWRLGA
jgi:hypothetical protein